MTSIEERMRAGRPVNAKRDQLRLDAARKAVETRKLRERNGLDSIRSQNRVQPSEAGRKQNYTKLDTAALATLLPLEQAILDHWLTGMHARFTLARLAAIEAELSTRGVDQDTINAHRFGIAEYDGQAAEDAERHGIAREDLAEGWMIAESTHFRPEDFCI